MCDVGERHCTDGPQRGKVRDAAGRVAAGRERSAASTGPDREADAAEPRYFTTSGSTVTDPGEITERSSRLELVACKCKCRFCQHCCLHLALTLKEKMLPVVASWGGVMMLTLTQDPKHYEHECTPEKYRGPAGAWVYAGENRVVARLIERLWKAGHLLSKKYIMVVEWQKETEMPHYHVLVEARFIPFEALAAGWGYGALRPAWLPAYDPAGNTPRFGHVRFSKRRFDDPKHAADYVCKYLTKLPEHGFPAWVMDTTRRVRRFSTSRRLFPKARESRREEPAEEPQERAAVRSIRERIARCGVKAVLVKVEEGRTADGEEVVELGRQFVGALRHVTFADAVRLLEIGIGVDIEVGARRVRITWDEGEHLVGADRTWQRRKRRAERRRGRKHFRAMVAMGLFD